MGEVVRLPRQHSRIADYLEDFLNSKRRVLGPKAKAVESYRLHLIKFSKSYGSASPANIQPLDIENYLHDLKDGEGHTLLPSTQNQHRASLSAFFTWLEAQGAVPENPVAKVSRAKVKEPEAKAIEPEMKAEVLRRAKEDSARMHALITLLFDTGLRIAEALDLNIEDVSFADDKIIIKHGKGDKPRTAYLLPDTRKALQRYLRERKSPRGFDPLFLSREGRLSVRRAQTLFQELTIGLSNSDGSPLHIHQCRHTFATEQLLRGMAPVHLMTLTGHRDVRTLERYTKAAQEKAAETEFRRLNQ